MKFRRRRAEEDAAALFGGTLAELLLRADAAAGDKSAHALMAALAALHAPHA